MVVQVTLEALVFDLVARVASGTDFDHPDHWLRQLDLLVSRDAAVRWSDCSALSR